MCNKCTKYMLGVYFPTLIRQKWDMEAMHTSCNRDTRMEVKKKTPIEFSVELHKLFRKPNGRETRWGGATKQAGIEEVLFEQSLKCGGGKSRKDERREWALI